MIDEELVKTNKAIMRLRYEENFDGNEEVNKILDLLQYHLFLVHTYFDKLEFSAEDIKLKLVEKLERTSD